MSTGPTLLVSEKDFRIVQIGDGTGVRYVLEVTDGCDSLGVERWREFKLANEHLRAMFGYMLRMARKEQ